jgi:hypothetical protein
MRKVAGQITPRAATLDQIILEGVLKVFAKGSNEGCYADTGGVS